MNWTGERVIPGVTPKKLMLRHNARYSLALQETKRHYRGPGAPGRSFNGDVRFLDAPCGTGYGAAIAALAGGVVLGIDNDMDTIAWAREHYDWTSKTAGSVRFDRHPIETLTDVRAAVSACGPFDVVMCFEGIEHVDEEVGAAWIESFSAFTRPGARLFISSPNPIASGSQVQTQDEIDAWRERAKTDPSAKARGFHLREYEPLELVALLESGSEWEVSAAWFQHEKAPNHYQARSLAVLEAWKDDRHVNSYTLEAIRT